MRHAVQANERLEILGDELRAIVADDARLLTWVFLQGPLDDRFHVDLFHLLANLPVHDVAAVTVQDRTEKVERPGDVDVADVHMPMAMWPQRLDEAGSFLRG